MKKYEFTGEEKINEKGVTVKRIRATEAFGSVRKGSLGGWIEGRHNLSSEGNCWVYDEAEVFDSAYISGNAKIRENAKIFDYAEIKDNSYVTDNAQIFGQATVSGSIWDRVKICDQAVVTGTVRDDAKIYGKAKIYSPARVYDEAEVFGTAKISGYSKICGKARVNRVEDVLSFHPVGPEKHTLTAFKTEESFLIYTLEKIELETLEQFLKRIENFQDYNVFKEYKAIAEVIKIRFNIV